LVQLFLQNLDPIIWLDLITPNLLSSYKINSLWKRDEAHNFIENDYSCTEFGAFKKWRVEEKIDGTNIRVYVQNGAINVKGRTNKAEVPAEALAFLTREEFLQKLSCFGISPVILFGEGFGGNIQIGKHYRTDVAFILFDVYLNGKWCSREEVCEIAQKLGLDSPADLGIMTEGEIVAFVKSKPTGKYNDFGYPMEGVIARSEPLVRFNELGANPVMWKLKVKDFKSEQNQQH
jgi:hypothetical protein